MTDVLLLVGASLVVAGTWAVFGIGIAAIVAGVIIIGAAALIAVMRTPPQTDDGGPEA